MHILGALPIAIATALGFVMLGYEMAMLNTKGQLEDGREAIRQEMQEINKQKERQKELLSALEDDRRELSWELSMARLRTKHAAAIFHACQDRAAELEGIAPTITLKEQTVATLEGGLR